MPATSRAPVMAFAALTACASACNLLVGGDELVFRDGGSGGGGSLAAGGSSTGGGGAGAGGTGGTGLGGAGGGVVVGSVPASIAVNRSSCAVLTSGKVRCWGPNESGQLGIGSTDPSFSPSTDVSLGDISVDQVVVGRSHVCARSDGDVYCWGDFAQGRLGCGAAVSQNIGDNESVVLTDGPVPLGGQAAKLAAGDDHTCALLTTGKVRCWGTGLNGRLGYGAIQSVGDNETPAQRGDVPLGDEVVTDIAAGGGHTCVVFLNGNVACWGLGSSGQLGYGNGDSIGGTLWAVAPVQTGETRVRSRWRLVGLTPAHDFSTAVCAVGGRRSRTATTSATAWPTWQARLRALA